jgi:hypothetical protein
MRNVVWCCGFDLSHVARKKVINYPNLGLTSGVAGRLGRNLIPKSSSIINSHPSNLSTPILSNGIPSRKKRGR